MAGGICGTYKLFNNHNIIKFSSFSNCYNTGIVSITYSTSTDFLIGDLHSFTSNRKIEKSWSNNSSPCFFAMPKDAQHLRTRELTPFTLSWSAKPATIKVSVPSHFHTLTPEEMQSDTFVDKLNLFVTKHPGPYKKWGKDTKAVNKGFPIFTD